ncbi:MAG: amidohydrolase family protein [Nocardioides sp.]|uniref:amidohydrolase family protein n=1 Tax=Nocardioides sp. TaxID=35761 RepID=UPI0039E71A3D
MDDLAIVGGRVIDPETGVDAIRTVTVSNGTITAVTTDDAPARRTLDARGQVVAPGFIDLHSHAQSLAGARLQALDGVTTALDLESGRYPIGPTLRAAADEGRPINFGYSVGWGATRAALVQGSTIGPDVVLPATPGWDRRWGDREVARLLTLLEAELAEGAIGIGLLLGYAPGVTRKEYLDVARLAATAGVGTFTHARFLSGMEPGSSLEGVLEVVAAAASTGASMHLCHLNSTAGRQAHDVVAAVRTAQAGGLPLTTEAYPYGAGATEIGAAFLDPANLDSMGIEPDAILLLGARRSVADLDELRVLRTTAPTTDVVVRWFDEDSPDDRAALLESLTLPGAAFASDSMNPLVEGAEVEPGAWPVRPDAVTHPRSTGCFAKVFRWLVRELDVLNLPEAVRRCSLVPADILAASAPAARRKGRAQVGCDADLVVFDPDRLTDASTYQSVAPSVGMTHVLVAGVPVVVDGRLDLDQRPGRPITSRA